MYYLMSKDVMHTGVHVPLRFHGVYSTRGDAESAIPLQLKELDVCFSPDRFVFYIKKQHSFRTQPYRGYIASGTLDLKTGHINCAVDYIYSSVRFSVPNCTRIQAVFEEAIDYYLSDEDDHQ